MRKELRKKFSLKKSTVANLDRDEQNAVKGGVYTTSRVSAYQFICDSRPENTCETCAAFCGTGSGSTPGPSKEPGTTCHQFICAC